MGKYETLCDRQQILLEYFLSNTQVRATSSLGPVACVLFQACSALSSLCTPLVCGIERPDAFYDPSHKFFALFLQAEYRYFRLFSLNARFPSFLPVKF